MRSLSVAVAQPPMAGGDLYSAIAAHSRAVRAGRAQLTVFPELSLTGYHLDAAPVDPHDPVLAALIDACRDTGSSALVGAPVRESGRDFIATVLVEGNGAQVVYRKRHLGAAEQRRFTAGEGPAVVAVGGWRIGLAICKDTGLDEHTDAVAACGIDVYAAGVVHHEHELTEQRRRVARIAARTRHFVVLASCSGATGEGYARCAGHSVIWGPDQRPLADAGPEVGAVATATLT